MKYIDKIGVEVETCLEKDVESGCIVNCQGITEDGSLELAGCYRDEGYRPLEAISKPVNKREIKEFLYDLREFINLEGINETMGFHIHISLTKKGLYSCLFSRKFKNYFMRELRKEFKDDQTLVDRTKNNKYCRTAYHKRYFMVEDDSRYQAINFRASYREHRTFEFRVFKSTDPKTMYKYVKFVIRTVNEYLRKYQNTEKFNGDIEVDKNDAKKEKKEYKETVSNKDEVIEK